LYIVYAVKLEKKKEENHVKKLYIMCVFYIIKRRHNKMVH
jgi:hypothetical protein